MFSRHLALTVKWTTAGRPATHGRRAYDRDVPIRPVERLDRLRARDPDALRDIVDTHARRLYRAARGLGFSAADAEDLSQEVLVTFLETLDRFEGRSTIGTWLFGILHHKAQARRRSHAREDTTDPIEEVFEARFDARGSWSQPPVAADRLVESHESTVVLHHCVAALPDAQREVFQLRQVEELTAADVSRLIGCTVTHVGVLLHRARLRLRACLEHKGWGHQQ